ncbi:hypothetical protein NQ317_014477, partial [Molorchus minor]
RNSEDALNLYFERYPERQQPSEQIFPRLENALMNYGSFVKLRPKQYAIEGRDEVEAVVIGAVLENPEISTREITVTKGVSKSRNQRILKKHKFKPYKIRLTHQLFPGDQERRMNFCNWFIRKCNENENFHRNVIWTDEARVTSNGIFNRHNRHHWSGHNEHVFQPRNMQGRFGFNIWIGIVGQRMIAPFIYDENLNAQRYVNILENIVEPYLEDLPLADLLRKFYQQDGAPAHNAAGISPQGKIEEFTYDLLDFKEHTFDNTLTQSNRINCEEKNSQEAINILDTNTDININLDTTIEINVNEDDGTQSFNEFLFFSPGTDIERQLDYVPEEFVGNDIDVNNNQIQIEYNTTIVEETAVNSKTLILHRGHIFDELTKIFVNTNINNVIFEIQIISTNGSPEVAFDAGGVFKDALTEFRETFYNKLCEEYAVFEHVYSDLIDAYVKFISSYDADIPRKALATFDSVDEDDLLEVLENIDCKQKNSSESTGFSKTSTEHGNVEVVGTGMPSSAIAGDWTVGPMEVATLSQVLPVKVNEAQELRELLRQQTAFITTLQSQINENARTTVPSTAALMNLELKEDKYDDDDVGYGRKKAYEDSDD